MPGGKLHLYGLFYENNQIGFQCFANYVPNSKNRIKIYHSNRTVIHPDYQGLGLGIKFITETSKLLKQKHNYKILAKFSNEVIYKSMIKNKYWKLLKIERKLNKISKGRKMIRITGFREKGIKCYYFQFINNIND